jgi:hypothetical protein
MFTSVPPSPERGESDLNNKFHFGNFPADGFAVFVRWRLFNSTEHQPSAH